MTRITHLRPPSAALPVVTECDLSDTFTKRFATTASSSPVSRMPGPSKAQRILIETVAAWLNNRDDVIVLALAVSSEWPDDSDEGRIYLDLVYEADSASKTAGAL